MNNFTGEFNVGSIAVNKVKMRLCSGLVILLVGLVSIAYPISKATKKEMLMTTRATGTFDVKMTPVEDNFLGEGTGRMTGDKQIHGDLEGIGKGEMIFAKANVEGSGAYVAIEKITGTLHGRKGSFIFQHSGWMAHGEQHMTITVVPDSGTDELVGLAGKFNIVIDKDGKHSYEFDYTLPSK